MEMYNDKLVDTGGDMTMDTGTITKSNPITVPVIKDITRDENFVDVSCIVWVHMCVCVYFCMCGCVMYDYLMCHSNQGPFEQAFSDDDDINSSLLTDSKSSSCGSHSSMDSEDIIKNEWVTITATICYPALSYDQLVTIMCV